MKFKILICVGALALLAGCSKNQNSNSTANSGFTYSLSYDSLISVADNSNYFFTFNVNVLSGNIDNNPLYFSFASLPTGVTVSPTSLRVTDLAGGLFTFTVNNATVGTDSFQLVVTGSSGVQRKTITMKIAALPNYGALLAGTYDSSYDFCTPNIYKYVSVISAVPDTPSELKISNIKGLGTGFIVSAYVTNVVTIPAQTISGYTIWGSGNYSLDSRPAFDTTYMLTIHDTLAAGGDTQTCTIHLQH